MGLDNGIVAKFNNDKIIDFNKKYYQYLFTSFVHDAVLNTNIDESMDIVYMRKWHGPRNDIVCFLQAHHPNEDVDCGEVSLTCEDLVGIYRILMKWRNPKKWAEGGSPIWDYKKDGICEQINNKLRVLQMVMGIKASDEDAIDFIFYDSY